MLRFVARQLCCDRLLQEWKKFSMSFVWRLYAKILRITEAVEGKLKLVEQISAGS
jgi:hypothetical protein